MTEIITTALDDNVKAFQGGTLNKHPVYKVRPHRRQKRIQSVTIWMTIRVV